MSPSKRIAGACALLLATTACTRWSEVREPDAPSPRTEPEAEQVEPRTEPEPVESPQPRRDVESAEPGEEQHQLEQDLPKPELDLPATEPTQPDRPPGVEQEPRPPEDSGSPPVVETPSIAEAGEPRTETEAGAGAAVRGEAPPRLGRGVRLFETQVVDANGAPRGRVVDVWLESSSGAVAGVLVELEGETTRRTIVEYESLHWSKDGTGPPRVLLTSEGSPEDEAAELFDPDALVEVSGEVVELELPPKPPSVLLLKVRDGENLLHRVRLEAGCLVTRRFPALEVGQQVVAGGVFTRDSTGKLLLASSLALGDERMELRDAEGVLLWEDVARGLLSARELEGASVLTAEGEVLALDGWMIDRLLGTVPYLEIEIDGVGRALPWSATRWEAEQGVLRLSVERSSLSELHRVEDEGAFNPL